jgi:excisionase family DNA binding protein
MATAPIFDVDALLAAIRVAVKDAVAEALVEHGIEPPVRPPPANGEWMKSCEAAEYVRLSEAHLETLRREGGGPHFERYGRRVRYKRADLDAWIEQRATKKGGRR